MLWTMGYFITDVIRTGYIRFYYQEIEKSNYEKRVVIFGRSGKGFVKKLYLFTVVAVTNLLQPIFRDMIPLRETSDHVYIINEALSILENASYFIPIPLKLKNILYQLREEKDIEKVKKQSKVIYK